MPVYKAKYDPDWSLKNLDTGLNWFPQYPLSDGVSVPVGSNLASQSRFGQQDPVLQWVSGKERTFTFTTQLFATDKTQGREIYKKYRDLEKWATKDTSLGRPPICIFQYGDHITETVLIESIDPKFTDVLLDGTYRNIDLNVTLRKYVPFTTQQIDPTRPAKESYYLVATSAESSYEMIARRFYGDPMYGDRLRKRHPQYPYNPPVGAKIHIPSKQIILREVVQPASHIFQRTEEANDAYQVILDERATRRIVRVV